MSRHINKPQSALLLGAGYVAQRLAPQLLRRGWSVTVTTRSGDTEIEGVKCIAFHGAASIALQSTFKTADMILSSIPPTKDGKDPALVVLKDYTPQAKWIGYLSATSVYGDRRGQWAFERDSLCPGLARGRARAEAELAWIETLWPVHIFRLAGIYGPGRAPFDKIRNGKARAVIQPGHIVNRIHVDDIIRLLWLSLAHPNAQSIYNVADGHPVPPEEVLDYAAELLKLPPPPRVDVNSPDLSEMARSFYAECKRINVDKARQQLGWTPSYPTYREGLSAILDQG